MADLRVLEFSMFGYNIEMCTNRLCQVKAGFALFCFQLLSHISCCALKRDDGVGQLDGDVWRYVCHVDPSQRPALCDLNDAKGSVDVEIMCCEVPSSFFLRWIMTEFDGVAAVLPPRPSTSWIGVVFPQLLFNEVIRRFTDTTNSNINT